MSDCDYTPPVWDDLPEIEGLDTSVVTDGCVGGSGIYDVFMEAHRDAIHQEYAKNRIKGVEYSKVYLGGMQAAMQNAVGFALGKDEAATKAALAKYAIEKAKNETELVGYQICKIQKEIELLDAQREMVAAQTWAEIAKTTDEIAEYMGQLLGTDTVDPIYTGPSNTGDDSIIGAQVDKTQQEEKLLTQKTDTELAQVSDTILDGTTKVAGVMRKNKNLLQRQADGFIRDAESKAAKMASDLVNIQFSTLDGDLGGSTIGGNSDSHWGDLIDTAFDNADKAEDAEGDIGNTLP